MTQGKAQHQPCRALAEDRYANTQQHGGACQAGENPLPQRPAGGQVMLGHVEREQTQVGLRLDARLPHGLRGQDNRGAHDQKGDQPRTSALQRGASLGRCDGDHGHHDCSVHRVHDVGNPDQPEEDSGMERLAFENEAQTQEVARHRQARVFEVAGQHGPPAKQGRHTEREETPHHSLGRATLAGQGSRESSGPVQTIPSLKNRQQNQEWRFRKEAKRDPQDPPEQSGVVRHRCHEWVARV